MRACLRACVPACLPACVRACLLVFDWQLQSIEVILWGGEFQNCALTAASMPTNWYLLSLPNRVDLAMGEANILPKLCKTEMAPLARSVCGCWGAYCKRYLSWCAEEGAPKNSNYQL